MQPKRIYVAGHTGLVGSALINVLKERAQSDLVIRTHAELDLRDAAAVESFFSTERPDCVILAAARVGGIMANSRYPVEFLLDNLAIATNVIAACHRHDVERLIVFGSNCAYPRETSQPIRETALLTGPFEPTNAAFATAKIAAIELCRGYNQQFGRRYLVAMPTGLYGPGDNYDPQNSHVAAAMIRRFHEAKAAQLPRVEIWGSGRPLRELLYNEDCARAGTYLAYLPVEKLDALLREGFYPLLNIGGGEEVSILELAKRIAAVVGYTGEIATDPAKPDGMPRKLLDGSRLAALGWHPQVPLDEGLKRAYADFLARHCHG